MATDNGERQRAPTLDGIRADHVARYTFARDFIVKYLGTNKKVLDLGCGVGYGSKVLADGNCRVVSVDISGQALMYAARYYKHDNITYKQMDAYNIENLGDETFDAVICFEVLEHLNWPEIVVSKLSNISPNLIFSVPNESIMPFSKEKFPHHFRHYIKEEITDLVSPYVPIQLYGQEGAYSPVSIDVREGRTIVGIGVFKEFVGRVEKRNNQT